MAHAVDVVVVGGGSAGWAVAGNLARAGCEVLVVDRRDHATGGARWLNAVPGWCFDEAGLERPTAPERFGGEVDAPAVVAVAGTAARVRVEHATEGFHVDMRALIARLRQRALGAGAREAQGAARAVTVEPREIAVEVEGLGVVRAQLAVDASGLGAALRTRVPELAARCPAVAAADLCQAAEHQHAVADRAALAAWLRRHGTEPGGSIAFLGVAGGYSTLTIFTDAALSEVGVLAGSIPAAGAPSGAEVARAFAARAPWVGERLYGGGGGIPLRYPYPTLGLARVALIGDAACQVYGTHGSGVGMGLIAARLLGDAVLAAADPGDPAVLDQYTRRFHRGHGGSLAAADSFRRFSQALAPRDIAALIERGLLDVRSIAAGMDQRMPEPDAAWLGRRAVELGRAPREAAMVVPAVARMLALEGLGKLTPAPRGRRARVHARLVEALVGPTPPPRPVEHVEVDVGPASPAS